MTLSDDSKREILRGLLVPLSLIAQATVSPLLSFYGVQPSLFLVVFVLFALRTGALPAVWMGFSCGMALDTYSIGTVGAFSVALTLVGFSIGQLHERRVHLGYPLRVSLLGMAALLHDVIWHLVSRHGLGHLPGFLLRVALPSTLYTMLVGAIVFALRPPKSTVRTW
ncbi:MAG: rod shape-determining protein MreD [Fibrobacterota bacterium]|nr:rod shape-determining protein MreD [Fibrobacterota bacterium]QQS05289.1 MAG: rod shape-determining protein MreD [Fibrobacterota bacterium]